MATSVLIPVLLALASAGGFAVSTSVQHRAAGTVSATGPTLLLRLSQRPLWLAGAVVGASAWLLHAVALNLGDLAVVQPLMLSTVVFALVVRAALDRTAPSRTELVAAAGTAGSLAVFLLACPASAGVGVPDQGAAAVAAGVSIAATTIMVTRDPERTPAPWLAVVAGWAFAVTAALLKLTGEVLAAGGVPALLGAWSTWALALCGLLGVMASQQSYQGGRLAQTLPLLNVVTALGAYGLGVVVFGQQVATEPLQLVVAGTALIGIHAGLRRLVAPAREAVAA